MKSIRTTDMARPSAIRVACAAAGVAGAFVPRELAALADMDDVPLVDLLTIAQESAERADAEIGGWVAESGLRTFHVSADGSLTWQTSVIVELAPSSMGRYRVTIYGEHVPSYTDVSRWDALRDASIATGATAEVLDLDPPPRGKWWDGYVHTARARAYLSDRSRPAESPNGS